MSRLGPNLSVAPNRGQHGHFPASSGCRNPGLELKRGPKGKVVLQKWQLKWQPGSPVWPQDALLDFCKGAAHAACARRVRSVRISPDSRIGTRNPIAQSALQSRDPATYRMF
jgi:hypothetical protein